MDLKGPYKVPTHKGCIYIISLVYKKSRVTQASLIKCKSQALSVLASMCKCEVMALRTNNALGI